MTESFYFNYLTLNLFKLKKVLPYLFCDEVCMITGVINGRERG